MLKLLINRMTDDPHGEWKLIRRLLQTDGRSQLRGYALVLLWMALAAGCTAAAAYLIGHAVNEAFVSQNFAGIAIVAIACVLVYATKGISTYAQAVSLAKINNRLSTEYQRRMLDKLLKQNLAYFSDKHSSEFISRIAFGAGASGNVLRLLITTLGRDLMTLIGLVTVMIIQAPLLSLIGILATMPSVMFVRGIVKRVRSISRTEFAVSAQIAQSVQETILGLRVVKALNLEDEMRRRVDGDTRIIEQSTNKLARVMNRSAPLMETLGGGAVGLVLIYAGYQIIEFNAPPGQFISFIVAFLLAYEPAKRIARLNVDLARSLIGVQVLYEVLDLPDPEDHQFPELEVVNGRIEFKDVKFEYRSDSPVLHGISFVAEAGQVTALVGPSGGGKSTIFNLLLRFYDAEHGEVLIDNQNIRHFSQSSVRSNISYVGQDVFLFHGSVKANIAFGRAGASEADIVAAARAAYAHDFILGLPEGYDTSVGEHGLQLSGGQRQRIAVARALIRNAPIILLDEPTASLDSESEVHVQKAIKHLAEGRTTLVIAHRLHTIRHADMIHVVENGKIVESGRHERLLRLGQRYAEVYNLNFGAQLLAKDDAAGEAEYPQRSKSIG
jgi:ABC-type multidrug transport system fused ATPase/permease subunit